MTVKFEDGLKEEIIDDAKNIKSESDEKFSDSKNQFTDFIELYNLIKKLDPTTLPGPGVDKFVLRASFLHTGEERAFDFLKNLVIKLEDKNVAMKKKIVALINENPESTDAQKQWVQELELEDNSEEAKIHRYTMNFIRNVEGIWYLFQNGVKD